MELATASAFRPQDRNEDGTAEDCQGAYQSQKIDRARAHLPSIFDRQRLEDSSVIAL